MENIESKQGKINSDGKSVFNFLSDLRNLDSLIPADKIQDWSSTEDTCSFSIAQAGEMHLRITGREANNFIKIEPEGKSPLSFAFFIQLKEIDKSDTRIKLTFRHDMNTMMKMMLKGPIQKGLDQIVSTIGGLSEKINQE